ncbi:MAG: hypothetical protein ACW986_06110 [Promethearchaeota archaeon]|jgi:hypothetical protein
MGRFVTIVRWTPEQGPEVARINATILNGTAPPSVLAAWSKIKVVTTAWSPNNQFTIFIYDVDEKDYAEASLTAVYSSAAAKMETYPVLNEEQAAKLQELSAKMAAGQ